MPIRRRGRRSALDCDRILDADYVSDTAIYQSFKKAADRDSAEEIHPAWEVGIPSGMLLFVW